MTTFAKPLNGSLSKIPPARCGSCGGDGRRWNAGATGPRVRDWRCGTNPGQGRGRQSPGRSASGEAPAADRRLALAGGTEHIAESAILPQYFPLGPVWGMARERAKEAGLRQVPAPGGAACFRGGWGTAVFEGATRNEE